MNKIIFLFSFGLIVFVFGNIYAFESNKTEQIKIQAEERISIAEINADKDITIAEIQADTTKKTNLSFVVFYITRFVIFLFCLVLLGIVGIQIYIRSK